MTEDGTPIGGVIHAWRAAPDTATTDPLIRPEWHDRANCGRNGIIGDDPVKRLARMFPARGGDITNALYVCDGCPVALECEAARQPHDVGVWGNRSGRSRRMDIA
jgi:hypothetical protein